MNARTSGEGNVISRAKHHSSRAHRPNGGPMNTRTIAIIALIIAVIVVIVLLT